MYSFDYVKPGSVDEAVTALAAEDAQAISGGQTLIPTLKQRLAQTSVLVDLSGCLGSDLLIVRDGDCRIGAGATHAAVAASDLAPKWLRALAEGIGDPQVRNRGTIGGSIANNDPSADYPAAVLGAGADITTNTMDTPPGCQSFPPDVNECDGGGVFPALGLDWDTGACANDCADQTVFSVSQ